MRYFSLLLLVPPLCALAAVPAPERAFTDPHSLTSLANPQAGPVPIADLFFARGNAGAAWSPDGKQVVVSTNLTGRYNLWRVSAAGSWPIQLAQSDDSQTGAVWSPDGKWIAFQSDHGGGEIFDLYAVPANGGAVVDLTNSDDISEASARWSADGKSLAFERKPKTATATDIAVFDWATRKVRELTHEATADHLWQLVEWSNDGHFIYANRINADFTDASAWRIDFATAKAEELTPHKGHALIGVSAVSPDGKWLALTSNARSGRNEAALFDIAKRNYRWLEPSPWETESGEFSPDGKQLSWKLNADGRTDIFLYNIANGKSEKVDLPSGLNTADGRSFASDGRLLLKHQASNTPSAYWIVGHDGKATQLTYSALASLDSAALPTAQLVHYKSFDGTLISAFVWLPFNLARDAHAPGVVLPHGGPPDQTVDSFNRTATALASRGYVCIAPNVRGSTGYGMAFQQANLKDLGGGDLQDEVYAAKFLIASGYVDAQKIGMTGGSYGGYMTLMALAKTPDVWAAGVEQYGIISWFTMSEHSDPALSQVLKLLLGDPVKDKKIYDATSPITFIKQIRSPMLVLQGENDIRVPKEEAEQVVARIKAQGGTVDVHYYADEGHGFDKRENLIDALQRTVAWFDRYLKGNTIAK
ncbi:S9 family peptidase [Pseudolysobacter antarcticus]|uniref:Acyl-peptide hydrolase n=1 Tax=Pseudolysobacter antarcticus TaxID=2511995 RepID=A0A411HNE1_9GAMM|nr:S9 family peptidase [Pseudolysobacter antarcticus]QBB72003.1 S9 family peptidase [Pseudolysobacter antarcticus]